MYRRPRVVFKELFALGQREDRAIAWVMIGCLLYFVALLPIAQRDSVDGVAPLGMPGVETFEQAATTLFFGSMMVLPLLFYLLAGIVFIIARLVSRRASAWRVRTALFWGWLASMPLFLFFGLLGGFNGLSHPGTVAIGYLWIVVLFWFWISGLAETSKVE